MRFLRPPFGVLLGALLLAACDAGGSLGGPSVPAEIRATAPIAQSALAGTPVAAAPSVRVVDQRGQAKAGVAVSFAVTAGGGAVGAATATTDAAGNASAGSWTLGSAGAQVVTATVGQLPPLEFTATVQPRQPTTAAAVSPTTQTAPVGAPVPAAPSVRVNDQLGAPLAGVTVTFAGSGGSTVTGATSTTNAQGIATVGAWRVGNAEGAYTLTASVAGLAPVQFTATAQGRAPATMVAVLSPGHAIAGYPVADAPRVRVLDHTGQGLGGVTVTFAVTGGGGTIAPATAVTDATGLAVAGTWTLGAAPGTNTLTATVPGVPAVQFTTVGEPRQPAGIAVASAATQSGTAGQPVAQLPAVRVTDQRSQPLAGVAVTFAVTAGGGTITGAAAITNAEGIARLGSWTLGPAAGANTVTASVAGLSAITFTVNASAPANPCTLVAHAVGATVNGALATTDCRYTSGEYVDLYRVSLPSAQRVAMRLSSTAFSPWLEVSTSAGRPVAFHADAGVAHLRLFARSGDYDVGATSIQPAAVGSYQLASSTFAGNDHCLEYWTTTGLSISGQIATSDCNYGGYLADEYVVYLRAGETLTVTMQSTAVDAYLELYGDMGTLLTWNDDGGDGNDARMTYMAGRDFAYTIVASTFAEGETGAYTLGVSASGGAAASSLTAAGIAARSRVRAVSPSARVEATRPAKRPR